MSKYLIGVFGLVGLVSAEFAKTYGGANLEWVLDMVALPDGSCVLAGATWSFGAGSIVLKLTPAGDVDWAKTYSGAAPSQVNSMIRTSDGGYALAGFSNFNVLKITPTGDVVWAREYGGIQLTTPIP